MSADDDISGPDADRAAAGEFVLGLLPAEQRAAFAARLASEPALRAEVAAWQRHFSSLDEAFSPAPAPAGNWSRIEARLFGAARGRVSLWNSVPFWRSFSGVAAAAAIIAIAINLASPPPDPNMFAAQLVAALHAEGSTVSFVALYNPQTGQIRLTALSGDAVPDKDYELWAIEGDKAPMSMGVVAVTARSDMRLTPQVLAGFGPGTVLAITLEQKGGSPTGAPQGPIVAKGLATPV